MSRSTYILPPNENLQHNPVLSPGISQKAQETLSVTDLNDQHSPMPPQGSALTCNNAGASPTHDGRQPPSNIMLTKCPTISHTKEYVESLSTLKFCQEVNHLSILCANTQDSIDALDASVAATYEKVKNGEVTLQEMIHSVSLIKSQHEERTYELEKAQREYGDANWSYRHEWSLQRITHLKEKIQLLEWLVSIVDKDGSAVNGDGSDMDGDKSVDKSVLKLMEEYQRELEGLASSVAESPVSDTKNRNMNGEDDSHSKPSKSAKVAIPGNSADTSSKPTKQRIGRKPKKGEESVDANTNTNNKADTESMPIQKPKARAAAKHKAKKAKDVEGAWENKASGSKGTHSQPKASESRTKAAQSQSKGPESGSKGAQSQPKGHNPNHPGHADSSNTETEPEHESDPESKAQVTGLEYDDDDRLTMVCLSFFSGKFTRWLKLMESSKEGPIDDKKLLLPNCTEEEAKALQSKHSVLSRYFMLLTSNQRKVVIKWRIS